MPDTIYFQWQNEYLLHTIYPLRELKLRDFLLAYAEIDTWKQYKGKNPSDIPQDVSDYCAAQRQKIANALDAYARLLGYLLDDDVTDVYRAAFPDLDGDIMAQITTLHKTFKTYFPNYHNPVRERYFASARVREFEDLRKDVLRQIYQKQCYLNVGGPTWPQKDTYQQAVDKLNNVSLKMVDQELSQLYQFLAAYGRLDPFKQQLSALRVQKQKASDAAAAALTQLNPAAGVAAQSLANAQAELNRWQNPPAAADLWAYFTDFDVTNIYQAAFPSPDPEMMLAINNLHKTIQTYLPGYHNPVNERYFLSQRLVEFSALTQQKQQALADKQKAAGYMGPTWWNAAANNQAISQLQSVILPMAAQELNKLNDFLWTYDHGSSTPADRAQTIVQLSQKVAGLQSQIQSLQASVAAQNAVIQDAAQALSGSDNDLLMSLIDPSQVKVEDIARWRVSDLKDQLDQLDRDQLMEQVVCRFVEDPLRYPLWLQYMVVHFSGMRYQSAHGSWADPKDLLISLTTKLVGDEIRRASDEAVDGLCEQKRLIYQSVLNPTPDDQDDGPIQVPLLAKTTDPDWQAKVAYHLNAIRPDSNTWAKRRELLNFRVDEEKYEIESMTDQQVLDQLRGLQDQIPDWMWKEIVQVTQLRLTEAADPNWDKLSQDDIDARWSSQMAQYRQIMDQWKAANLGAWRPEHEMTEEVIVTRAVCNEVAEHIQHVRGNNPGAGLTARPDYYQAQERNPALKTLLNPPYFVKARSAADFRSGASILFLQWVNKQPPIWNIALPLTLSSGEDLVAAGEDNLGNKITNTGSAYIRNASIQTTNPDGSTAWSSAVQWLRWLHEATVVEVADTADGPIIYTFETALPFDDKRQSTIGVFKHMAWDLNYAVSPSVMRGILVGYTPEGSVPYQNLRFNLNWNKILLREAYTEQQLDEYWQKVAPEPFWQVEFGLEEQGETVPVPPTWAEIVPPIKRRVSSAAVRLYEQSPSGRSMRARKPLVELGRGVRVQVATVQVLAGKTRYYQVTGCDLDPRAEGLYLRASDVVVIKHGSGSRPVRAVDDLYLYRITGLDAEGRVEVERGEVFLPEGTRFRLSKVQHAGRASARGVIHTAGGGTYYLVIDCPRKASALGWLVKKGDFKTITEGEWDERSLRVK